MARLGTPLDTADPFPSLAFDTVAHGSVRLPDALAGRFSVALFYRAHW